ncbi:DUF523 domain-containing protein [Clostridium rectalis]|uniref:DUF523 domain-containing protein n=1 Tax=Clostridium rectalis TaxID=2040295 RepID=UPI000F6368C4|nr:DUF523 domain-containing protein [Clostridium rectalis]
MIIISACLCGINCKYNGKNNLSEDVLKLFKQKKAILVCPEQLGGLQTPRPPQEIINGTGMEVLKRLSKVKDLAGNESTDKFIKGAYETLNIAKECKAQYAILKSNSPSCGYGMIYDGTFSGKKIKGNGVTAELLRKNGIKIFTEYDFEKLKEEI